MFKSFTKHTILYVKKEFLINIILLLTINLLVKPLYILGVDAHIQNIVGEQTYGVYFALFNLVFLFQFIIEPGILSFNSRNIAQNPETLRYHLPRILGVKIVLFIPFIVAMIIGFFAWGYEVELLPLYILIGFNLFLSTTFIYLRSNIAAIGKYRIDSLLSALDKLLMLFILGILSWTPMLAAKFTIYWLVYGQMAAYIIACLIALIILRNHITQIQLFFSFSYFKKLVSWSFPFILILLFMSLYNKMDGIMLERMLDDSGRQAGIYAAGYRLVDALNMLGYMIAALLLPMYSGNLKKPMIISNLLHLGLKLMVVGTAIASLTLIFYGSEILPYIYNAYEPYYAQVLEILMLSFVGVSVAYIYGTLLVANNNLKSFNVLLSIGVMVNLLLNLYFIPKLEAYGAAIATAVTQMIVLLGQIILVYKKTEIKFDGILYARILTYGIISTTAFYLIQTTNNLWVYGIPISILISVIAALGLKLIPLSEFLTILKKRPTRI